MGAGDEKSTEGQSLEREGENLTGERDIEKSLTSEVLGLEGQVLPELKLGKEEIESHCGTERDRDIWQQIEALNSPCFVEFRCSVSCGEGESVPSKRVRVSGDGVRVSGDGVRVGRRVSVEFEWISGEDRDLLHQIVQYLKNTTFQELRDTT